MTTYILYNKKTVLRIDYWVLIVLIKINKSHGNIFYVRIIPVFLYLIK